MPASMESLPLGGHEKFAEEIFGKVKDLGYVKVIQLSQAEYDELSTAEKQNPQKLYLIDDDTEYETTSHASSTYLSKTDASSTYETKSHASETYSTLEDVSSYKQASGSIATFSDGSELPMRSLKAYIEPVQDLHGYDWPWVGGAGKNKCPIDTTSFNGSSNSWYSLSGSPASATADGTKVSLAAGKYTIKIHNVSGISILQVLTASGEILVEILTNSQTSGTFTLDSSMDIYIRIKANASSISCKTMLENGSTASLWQPYSNECPISGWTACNVGDHGKNYAPSSGYTRGLLGWNRNNIDEVSSSNTWITSPLIAVKPNTTYTVSCTKGYISRFYVGDIAHNALSYTGSKSEGDIFQVTTGATAKYIRYSIGFDGTIVTTSDYGTLVYCQIEEGSQATTYEPYNGTTYPIQFTDGSNPLTVYSGYVDIVSGLLVVDRAITSYIDSDVSLHTGSISGVTYAKVPKQVNSKTYNNYSSEALTCNKFKNGNSTALQGGVGLIRSDADTKHYFIGLEPGTTLEEAKEIINGTQLVYERATPQTHQLTPTQVKSLLGENRVWADTGDVELEYQPQNVIAELRGEILSLQDTIAGGSSTTD